MQLLIFCIFLRAAFANADGPPTMALAFIGQGYNAIIGDPHAATADPGWRHPVLNKSWTHSHTDWLLPVQKCSYDAITTSISGGNSAQSSMLKDWNVKGSVGLFHWASVSFTASDSVSSMNTSSWQESEHFFEARASCQLWVAQLPPPTLKYEIDPYFAAQVAGLPTSYSLDAERQIYDGIVANYGTHVASSVVSGGMMVQRSSMTGDSFRSYQQSSQNGKWSVDAGAKGSFWIFADPKASGGETYNKEATQAFQQAVESGEQHEFYQGGAPFVGQSQGGPSAWAQGLKDAMVPVGSSQNELLPLSSLLTATNFPPDLEPNIAAKKAVLEQAMANICEHFPGCTTAPRDPLPPMPPRTITEGTAVESVAWSPDGANITSGSDDMFVRTWSGESGRNVGNGKGHTDFVYSVTYSPDGKYLASGSFDHTIRIWDAATWVSVQTLQGHTYSVLSVTYSPDGKYLASGSADETIRIWDAATWVSVQTLQGHTNSVKSVTYSPDGKYLASGSGDRTIRIWDAATWVSVQTLQG